MKSINKTHEVIRLVKTLSGPEKRYFKLYCKKQAGQKVYLDLFEIISQQSSENPEKIKKKFCRKHPEKSFENNAHYLLKIITDALVDIGIGNDKWYQQYQSIMRSKILFERSLTKEGYKEIKKAQQLAEEIQDNLTLFQSYRLELNHLSKFGFENMEEKDLVEIQMKSKNHLRQLHLLQEHSSLYETLRLRLIKSGRSFSKSDTDKLNDLLISELSLITRGSQQNFESQKIHLLFQSFFLTHTGQFKSALKSFRELNNLFEDNIHLWSFPPFDYLFTLEGILDNLRTIGFYDEIYFYLDKLENLLKNKYPDYFKTIASQTIYIYKLHLLINFSTISEAIQFANSIPPELLENEFLVGYEERTELMFYIGLVYFSNGELNKAHKQMAKITAFGKVKEASSAFKVAWLTHILIHYELDNLDFLDYEIRSYKRAFANIGKTLKIENLIFKTIRHDPKRKNFASNLKLWSKIENSLEEVNQNSYEMQLLKYYDFGSWIKNKLNQE